MHSPSAPRGHRPPICNPFRPFKAGGELLVPPHVPHHVYGKWLTQATAHSQGADHNMFAGKDFDGVK